MVPLAYGLEFVFQIKMRDSLQRGTSLAGPEQVLARVYCLVTKGLDSRRPHAYAAMCDDIPVVWMKARQRRTLWVAEPQSLLGFSNLGDGCSGTRSCAYYTASAPGNTLIA